MKAIVIVTDSEAVRGFERALLEAKRGFTVVPDVWGGGTTGLRTGDRVHPGGCSLMFTVVPDDELDAAVALVRATRDRIGAECTHVYVTAVDQVA